MIYRAFFCLVLALANLNARAAPDNTATHIQAAVMQYLHEQYSAHYTNAHIRDNVVFHVGNLDTRLRLATCNHPLETQLNNANILAPQVSIRVRCTAPSPWSLYVPVKVEVFEEIIVAARTLAKGTVLSAEHLTQAKTNVALLRGGYYASLSNVLGMELKRPIKTGGTITQSLIRAPKVISRGEVVTLEASNASIAVVTQAKALSHGRLGQKIRVQNLNTKRVIDAEVTGPGRVVRNITL